MIYVGPGCVNCWVTTKFLSIFLVASALKCMQAKFKVWLYVEISLFERDWLGPASRPGDEMRQVTSGFIEYFSFIWGDNLAVKNKILFWPRHGSQTQSTAGGLHVVRECLVSAQYWAGIIYTRSRLLLDAGHLENKHSYNCHEIKSRSDCGLMMI